MSHRHSGVSGRSHQGHRVSPELLPDSREFSNLHSNPTVGPSVLIHRLGQWAQSHQVSLTAKEWQAQLLFCDRVSCSQGWSPLPMSLRMNVNFPSSCFICCLNSRVTDTRHHAHLRPSCHHAHLRPSGPSGPPNHTLTTPPELGLRCT